MWLARDKCGELWIFFNKPRKLDVLWDATSLITSHMLKPDLFPEVQWEDKEPKFIRIIREEWII